MEVARPEGELIMKRLTKRIKKHSTFYNCDITCNQCFNGCKVAQKVFDRLAATEDILGEEYNLDRLRELIEADREGKIPKYTIGDTVYDRFGCAWEVISVELHSIRTKNEWLYRCEHKGTDDYCALWYFEAFPSKEAALRREQDE